MSRELGKIKSVKFGIGGYQGAMIGIHFNLQIGSFGGVSDSKAAWDANLIEVTDQSSWTEADRSKDYAEIMRYVSDLLKAAKVATIEQLENTPIELEMDNNTVKSWRVLTEVL